MSWLKNHLRHFVLPGIYALAHSRGKPLTAVDIKPRDKEVRPASDCKYVEAGMLYAVVSSVLRKGDPTREAALGLCRQIGRAKDAEFVYEVDKRGGIKELGKGYKGVEGSDVLHSMLCNSMRRLKRKMDHKGQLLLPGRDVWCWEVMARKLTVDSTYDPRVSRAVAYDKPAMKTCIDEWKIQNWQNVLFFDTGFSGSIPRAIADMIGLDEINMLLLSSGDPKHQIFRTHTGSRKKALAFEYLAKYFHSGAARGGKPYQQLADLDEFIKAAMLTIWLWYHVSPTRLPSYREAKNLDNYKFKSINPKFTQQMLIGTQPMYTLAGGGTIIAGNSTAISTLGTWPMNVSITSSASTSITNDPIWIADNASSGQTKVQALQTLDHLWGASASGQILIDQHDIKAASGIPKPLLTALSGFDDKYNEFTPVTANTKKVKPYAFNPQTLELVDAKTGKSVEKQMDANLLAIAKGKKEPTKDGFGFGEYPGPPVINAKALKELAGVPVNHPLPEIEFGLETGAMKNGVASVFKTVKFTGKDGTEKVYKTPLIG
jgi:hypothetical protein